MNIIDIAKGYFDLDNKGNGIYQIKNPSGEFDSVVLWETTNSYHRFSTGKSGGIYEFLKYIVGLPESEINEQYGILEEDSLIKKLKATVKRNKLDTGLSIQDVVFQQGYNKYIESRMISEETAKYYNLEVNGEDAIIPLYNVNNNRIGSLYRHSNPDSKGDRYRTLLVSNFEKPCVWPFPELYKRNSDSIIVLVEGAWSAMRIKQVMSKHIGTILPLATLGTNVTDELKQYLYEFRIISILDDDTGGQHVQQELQRWQKDGIKVEVYLPVINRLSEVNNTSGYIDDLSDIKLLNLFKKIKKCSSIIR